MDYFHEYGYHKIGICGAGDLGRLLYEEIKDSDIQVLYFIDRNSEGLRYIDEIPVVTMQEIQEQEKADVLVIAPEWDYEAVNQVLLRICQELPTLSLREAVYEF